ncbi:hypothetical protein WG907_04505 [Sphingobium sp. AN558]|uniref:hypothetical protein n=1 Tax=Sphingobium sp. AN558 TaxID=3133442 RepID=UPI0030C31FAA
MTLAGNSVPSSPLISDERVRNMLRKEYDRAINILRETTRAQLAADSGVNIHQIDAIVSMDTGKQRRVAMADAMSICWALGEHAVNSMAALMGFTARPLEAEGDLQPTMMAANALAKLSVIATAAADGRIDHSEMPACREAADALIATILPISSHGGQ